MGHSVASELAIFENTLRPLTPHFEQALAGAIPVERLMRSIMVSIERNPKLLDANRQSLLNASMSAACLALEVDGVTGQAYFIPFKGVAQLVIGYKGMNTLAARSGYTVQGEVVREGDAFDYELGDKGFVRHKPKLGSRGPILAAWATASSLHRPSIISVLGIDDIMAIKAKSPGGSRMDSPWMDMMIGFPAMAAKSAKRRLSRAMPLNADPRFHLAAAMEEAVEERGKLSWIDPARGVQIEGEFHDDGPLIRHEQRTVQELISPRTPPAAEASAGPDGISPGSGSADDVPAMPYIAKYRMLMMNASTAVDGTKIGALWNSEKELRNRIVDWPPNGFEELQAAVKKAIAELKETAA
jgi:recombination protein RecT